MNTKMLVTQFGLLPEEAVKRLVNTVSFPIRSAMLKEAVKDEPNTDMIRSCKELDYILGTFAPERVYPLDDTANFVFSAGDDDRDEKQKRAEALRRYKGEISAGRAMKPTNPVQYEAGIQTELQKMADERIDGLGKAIDAIAFIDSIVYIKPDEIADELAESAIGTAMKKARGKKAKSKVDPTDDSGYDEDSLPDWLKEQIEFKLISAGEFTVKDAQRRLNKAHYEHQRTAPRAAMEAAAMFLKHFGITTEMVLGRFAAEAKALDDELSVFEEEAGNLTTLDNPPPENTVAEKKSRYRVAKAAQQGITSADMAMASGVK